MTFSLDLGIPEFGQTGDRDNITDWCLSQFRSKYGDHVSKDDIWAYAYGVMHAPDWRDRYRHDLQRNLPRIPFADDFEAFSIAGRFLMDLHINYETADEWPVECRVDGVVDDGGAGPDAYRIDKIVRWGKDSDGNEDCSVLHINSRCCLTGIPSEAEDYKISGRSPLRWAIASLRVKRDNDSGITDDPNDWYEWADEPFNLIRHLRKLVTVSVESVRIFSNLPPSLPASEASNDTSPRIAS